MYDFGRTLPLYDNLIPNLKAILLDKNKLMMAKEGKIKIERVSQNALLDYLSSYANFSAQRAGDQSKSAQDFSINEEIVMANNFFEVCCSPLTIEALEDNGLRSYFGNCVQMARQNPLVDAGCLQYEALAAHLFREGLDSFDANNNWMILDDLFKFTCESGYLSSKDQESYLTKACTVLKAASSNLPYLVRRAKESILSYCMNKKRDNVFDIVLHSYISSLFKDDYLQFFSVFDFRNLYDVAKLYHDDEVTSFFENMGYVQKMTEAKSAEEELVSKVVEQQALSDSEMEKLNILVATNSTTHLELYNVILKKRLAGEEVPSIFLYRVFEGIGNSVMKYYGIKGFTYVVPVNTIYQKNNNNNADGLCIHKKEQYSIYLKDQVIENFSYESPFRALETLFHEMRHVTQFANEDNTCTYRDYLMFKDRVLSNLNLDYYLANYDSIGIEIDAYTKGCVLAYRYLQELDPSLADRLRHDIYSNIVEYRSTWHQEYYQKRVAKDDDLKSIDTIFDEVISMHPDLVDVYPILQIEYNLDGKKKTVKEFLDYMSGINNRKMRFLSKNILHHRFLQDQDLLRDEESILSRVSYEDPEIEEMRSKFLKVNMVSSENTLVAFNQVEEHSDLSSDAHLVEDLESPQLVRSFNGNSFSRNHHGFVMPHFFVITWYVGLLMCLSFFLVAYFLRIW